MIAGAPKPGPLGGVLLAAALAAGCVGPPPPEPAQDPASRPAAVSAPAPAARGAESPEDVDRLVALARSRSAGGERDYPIGSGDLIEISAPEVAEIQVVTVRVAPDGTIALPLLGTLQAGGKTERELRGEIRAALGQYMYEPQFSLLVKQHRSRQVGVLGAVAMPGPYPVDGLGETILDMLSKAGGLTDDATRRILFIPAAGSGASGVRLASLEPVAPERSPAEPGPDAGEILPRAAPPIVIDLDGMDEPTQQLALSIPVRPGDTLMVLGGGKVFLRGWVAHPGAYDMARGLTVLGVIAQAGGFSFPAKEDRVRILREQPGSNVRRAIVVDVAAIQSGPAEDVPVREGDVIEIPATAPKLAAYSVYRFISGLFRVGLALTPF